MSETEKTKQPATVICIGMAGSGKTTFMQRLNSHLHSKKTAPYVINLDPAVLKVPFGTNIDIRDSVNYKKVMKDYGLGPNGAIMTSLNLFATKIDQVLNIVEKRAPSVDHIIIDTPGQIECFIWSASGAIITDALASSLPTIVAYIVDTPRTTSPTTFMSNMLYACSILYKTKLPMVVVFNKTDAQESKFAEEWMEDFELFQKALREDEELNGEGENGSGYMGSLMNSLSLMLEEFYRHLDVVSVSAYTGKGFDEFLNVIDKKVEEYNKDYKAERDRIVKERAEEAARQKTQSLTKLMKDIGIKDKKDLKNAEADQVDALSDTEDVDEEGAGEIIRDEDEPQREYTFEDRTEAGIQARYREALEQSQGDTKELEKMLEGIDRS
jgi:GPN-loop GTPase